MTATELLTMVGLAWSRLLIYPGGLAAFAIVWLIGRLDERRVTGESHAGSALADRPLPRALVISAVVLPWLGLALLPLPPAAALARQTDLVVLLALLEWPRVLAIAHELRPATPGAPTRASRRLVAALNSYPPLILATLVLALAAGSFDPLALARAPGEQAPAGLVLARWLGAAAWTLALPPALGIGPFAACPAGQRWLRVGQRLRALGLFAFAALLWVALIGEPRWLLPLPPLLLLVLLWGYHRVAAGQPARRWARAYVVLDALLLLVLLWFAYAALQQRLT